MITVYGIPNCDTVKKATTWLKSQHHDFRFHDYKKQGITATKLKEWSKEVGWEVLLNKKGTTWRDAAPDIQASVTNERSALAFLKDHTSAIKRPVIEKNGKLVAVGYNESVYSEVL